MGSVRQKERKRPRPMALRMVLCQRQLKQRVEWSWGPGSTTVLGRSEVCVFWMNGYTSFLHVFFFWFPVELRIAFRKVLEMFAWAPTLKVKYVSWSPPARCCQQQCWWGREILRKLVRVLGLLEDSHRVKNSDLCSVLILKVSPIVYFSTIYIKEERRMRSV